MWRVWGIGLRIYYDSHGMIIASSCQLGVSSGLCCDMSSIRAMNTGVLHFRFKVFFCLASPTTPNYNIIHNPPLMIKTLALNPKTPNPPKRFATPK